MNIWQILWIVLGGILGIFFGAYIVLMSVLVGRVLWSRKHPRKW